MTTRNLSDILSLETYNPDDEWMLLSHMIMSGEVLKYCFKLHEQKHLLKRQFAKNFQEIYRWTINYYRKFDKAPKHTIQNIFDLKRNYIEKDEAQIIETYLERLSDEFENYSEENIDAEFIKKIVVPRFIKRYHSQALLEEIKRNVDQEQFENIQDIVSSFRDFKDDEELDPTMGVEIPGLESSITKYYAEEKDQNAMFFLPGAIGQFIGPIYRGKTYAITGVEKSGKTLFCSEIGYIGAWFHKLKVLDINLEMPSDEKKERIWQRQGDFAIDVDHGGDQLIPIFDCVNNQYGSCEVKEPVNEKPLLLYDDSKITFYQRPDWKICDHCREFKQRANTSNTKRFIPALWFKPVYLKVMSKKRLIRSMKKQEFFGMNNYRIKCFPRFSATFDEIERFIMDYILKNNFKPDIIILDYPDIMAPIQGHLMDRFNIDYNFKKCAGLAQNLNCAMVIADQAIKSARIMDTLDVMSTSESKTKDAHIDIRLTLNQTKMEYLQGVQRLGMLFRRKGKLLQNEIILLQNFNTCNPLLDSCWWKNAKTNFQTLKTNDEI